MSTSLADALVKDLTVRKNHTHLGPSAVQDLEWMKETNGAFMG